MKVLNLVCLHEHRFEGWFASEVDYLSQTERGLVESLGQSSVLFLLLGVGITGSRASS